MLKSDTLYKLGAGPIDKSWNQRFFVLDTERQQLCYYKSSADIKRRGTIDLKNVLVSNIRTVQERPCSFSIQTSPPGEQRTYYLSCLNEQQAKQWQKAIIKVNH
mgnify:CR=1 FL=1